MGKRLPILLLALGLILFALWLVLTRPAACSDPSGCIYLPSGDPIWIDVEVLTSGLDQPVSLEIKQMAELAIIDLPAIGNHSFAVSSFYAGCLPEEPSQSSVEMSASLNSLVVLGPACSSAPEDFELRMARAGKMVISPLQFRLSPSSKALSFYPDIRNFGNDAALNLTSLNFSNWIVSADSDSASTQIANDLCTALNNQDHHQCVVLANNESAPPEGEYDALVEVSMEPNALAPARFADELPDLTRIMISLDSPVGKSPGQLPKYWIGPQIWQQRQDLISAFEEKYTNDPVTLASLGVKEDIAMIASAIQNSSSLRMDGGLTIPRSLTSSLILENGKNSELFRYSCISTDCPMMPMSLYRLVENEYIPANP